jgi:hypothetical protein
MPELNPTRSGWSRPENYVQWAVIAALGFWGFKELDVILPLVNRVLEDAIMTAIYGFALCVIGAVALSKGFHQILWSWYKSGIRFLTNLVVTIDPIGILKNYRDQVRSNLKEMSRSEGALAEQERSLEDLIQTNTDEYNKNMRMVSAAKKQLAGGNKGMKGTMVLSARQAGRLEESNMTYQGLLNKVKTYRTLAARMREAAEFMAEDIDQTIIVKEKERKMVRAAYKSLMNAKKVMQGDEQRELYDMALENLANDYFSKIGEMEQFMDESKSFLDGMDLQNGVYEEDALAKLDEWEKKTDGIMSVGQTKVRIAGEPGEEIGRDDELSDAATPVKRQSYANLFDLKK